MGSEAPACKLTDACVRIRRVDGDEERGPFARLKMRKNVTAAIARTSIGAAEATLLPTKGPRSADPDASGDGFERPLYPLLPRTATWEVAHGSACLGAAEREISAFLWRLIEHAAREGSSL